MNGFRPFRRSRWPAIAASLGALIALGAIGLAGGRAVSSLVTADQPVDPAAAGPSNQNTPFPRPDETPIPGATPDKTKPDWWIPYENQDRLAPKFHGEINGLEMGRATGPTPQCAKIDIRADGKALIAGTPFGLNVSALPLGVTLAGPITVATCEDGRILWVEATFNVEPGTPLVNAGGATITVNRLAGVTWWPQEAPRDRLSATQVAGRPAVTMASAVDTIGPARVYVLDREIAGSTRIVGLSVSLEFTKTVSEALYR